MGIRDILGLTSTQAVVSALTVPWQCHAELESNGGYEVEEARYVKGLWDIPPEGMTPNQFREKFGPYVGILTGNVSLKTCNHAFVSILVVLFQLSPCCTRRSKRRTSYL